MQTPPPSLRLLALHRAAQTTGQGELDGAGFQSG